MSASAIRIALTPQLNDMFTQLSEVYPALSKAEILKLALSEFFNWRIKGEGLGSQLDEIPMVDEKTEKMIGESLEDFKAGRYTKVKNKKELRKALGV